LLPPQVAVRLVDLRRKRKANPIATGVEQRDPSEEEERLQIVGKGEKGLKEDNPHKTKKKKIIVLA